MSKLLFIYFIIFALLTIVGGVIGFVKAQSKASLIAGSVSGALLLVAAILLRGTSMQAGLIVAAVVSLLLAGRFVPAFLKKRAFMPAGMMSVLSVAGLALSIVGFFRCCR
jgi:uncharacterized membrane protein (UPF0136 family)